MVHVHIVAALTGVLFRGPTPVGEETSGRGAEEQYSTVWDSDQRRHPPRPTARPS